MAETSEGTEENTEGLLPGVVVGGGRRGETPRGCFHPACTQPIMSCNSNTCGQSVPSSNQEKTYPFEVLAVSFRFLVGHNNLQRAQERCTKRGCVRRLAMCSRVSAVWLSDHPNSATLLVGNGKQSHHTLLKCDMLCVCIQQQRRSVKIAGRDARSMRALRATSGQGRNPQLRPQKSTTHTHSLSLSLSLSLTL